ncbi:hypothetical protein GCM10028811_08960 [Uliginosibacterium sediminicola]
MKAHRVLCSLLCLASLAGCHRMGLDNPGRDTLLPSGGLRLTPHFNVSYVDMVLIGGAVALVYKVVDPMAPAWEIEETRREGNLVSYRLSMQRISSGGEGEARLVLARRAAELARERGMQGYQLIHYSESIDSRLFLPRRMAEADVALIAAPAIKPLPKIEPKLEPKPEGKVDAGIKPVPVLLPESASKPEAEPRPGTPVPALSLR